MKNCLVRNILPIHYCSQQYVKFVNKRIRINKILRQLQCVGKSLKKSARNKIKDLIELRLINKENFRELKLLTTFVSVVVQPL